MDTVTLTFNFELNISLSVGDVAFYLDVSTGDTYMIGTVTSIDRNTNSIICDISPITPRPEAGDFIFFAKDGEINISGLVGYYASVNMTLSGSSKKELYAVSTEVFKSS